MTRAAPSLWLLSVAGGAIAAFATLGMGLYGLIATAVLAIFAARLSQRTIAFSGLLVGFGAATALLVAAANARCAGAGEGRAVCVAYGGDLALVISLVLVLAGAAITSIPVLSRIR